MPRKQHRGRRAEAPTEIPAKGWWDILKRVKNEISSDHVSVVSAGVAFFGLLAIFPAIAAVISIAGFFLDPADVAGQLDSLVTILPESAASIIQDQITAVTGGDETATGIAALFGIAVAFYGATKGMLTLMEGMNVAYDEEETRGIVALYATGGALTLFLIFGILVSMGAILVVPVVLDVLPLPGIVETIISWAQWPVLAALTMFGLAVVYRFGPSREDPKWRWVSPGAIVATILWLAGTVGFSIYAQNFGSYNETYGTIGGVIILLTWLWISAYIVLAGAELNSEMEHQTRLDTTTGQPRPQGQRGAVKADTDPDLPEDTTGDRQAAGRSDDGVVSRKPSLVAGLLGLLALRAIRKPRPANDRSRG
ncbi:YihY/virulence factor BrkB family protein [Paracoccus zeaxanthinifaciens]|uniref:YihY/virulence factor BrkB family protein n=1 Tax=Paracoccus zeaxanthinifaciens TaxID=187400 RepID=UPI0003B65800|nr:YihY/virulence factor BrkB family protein [Paracoccus zeaxanthinifaciens]